jgi:hypothetical protein
MIMNTTNIIAASAELSIMFTISVQHFQFNIAVSKLLKNVICNFPSANFKDGCAASLFSPGAQGFSALFSNSYPFEPKFASGCNRIST